MSWKVVQTLVEYGYSIEEADKSMLDFSKCIEAMHCQRQDVVSMLDLCFHYGYNWERSKQEHTTNTHSAIETRLYSCNYFLSSCRNQFNRKGDLQWPPTVQRAHQPIFCVCICICGKNFVRPQSF